MGEVMKRIFFVASLCLLSAHAYAQEHWGHRLDVDIDVPYGADPAQTADLYMQAQRPAPGSALEPLDEQCRTLIWFHGGGCGGNQAHRKHDHVALQPGAVHGELKSRCTSRGKS